VPKEHLIGVTRVALENAVSVAVRLLLAEVTVTQQPERERERETPMSDAA
jgi:hypothetical protein